MACGSRTQQSPKDLSDWRQRANHPVAIRCFGSSAGRLATHEMASGRPRRAKRDGWDERLWPVLVAWGSSHPTRRTS